VFELAILVFFVALPAGAVYQSGRPVALLLPVALVLVWVQWLVTADRSGEDSVLPGIALGAAIVGLVVSVFLLALRRGRPIRP
jgi:hypothetical protein